MDPNASSSLDADDKVVDMLGGDVNAPPAPEPTPAPTGGETPQVPAPAPEPTPAPSGGEGGETPSAAEPSPAPEAPPAPAPEPTTSAEETQRIVNEYLAYASGGVYKTSEELEKARGFETLATVPSLTETITQLQEDKVEFANPVVQGLNDYLSKGGDNPELYMNLQELKVDDMDALEVRRTKMQLDNNGLSSDEINAHLADKYKQFGEDDERYNEADVAQGKINMKIDANEDRKALAQMQHEIQTPDPEKVRVREAEEATQKKQAWDPVISTTVKEFSEIEIPLNKDNSFKFAIPEEDKSDMVKALRESIDFSDATLDDEGKSIAKQIVHNRFIVDNFQKIAGAIAEQARSLTDEQWLVEAHNPSPAIEDAPPPAEQPKDAIETILEFEGAGERGFDN